MTHLQSASRPIRAIGVDVRLRHDDVYLTPPDAPQVFLLNDTAFALWELCDGDTAVREMVQAVSALFDGPADSLERDVMVALDELIIDGLVTCSAD